MSENTIEVGKHELITLQVRQVGFVVYGIGPGATRCSYRDQPLPDFLEQLWLKMYDVKDEVNAAWNSLDKDNRDNPANVALIRQFLLRASWAYAMAVEMVPFIPHCRHGPTDPMRHFFIKRLEEVFTKCFAAAHLYGQPDESVVGLYGLMTDFEINGGIDQKTQGPGNGLRMSVIIYHIAYWTAAFRQPVHYQKFGDLIGALAKRIEENYPKVAPAFAATIKERLENPRQGFGSKEFTSPEKTSMIEKLTLIAGRLENVVIDGEQEVQKLAMS